MLWNGKEETLQVSFHSSSLQYLSNELNKENEKYISGKTHQSRKRI